MLSELPSDIKLSTFKEIFGMLSQLFKDGYIDSFGVVTGNSKFDAYIPKCTIKNETFVKYFGNTVMNFDDVYDIFKHSKKEIQCDMVNGTTINELKACFEAKDILDMLKPVLINISTPIKHVESGFIISFEKYNNPHIYKTTTVYELDLNEFVDAIVDGYSYRRDHYIITKEAIPKPKKLIKVQESISEIVQDAEESIIYFTTLLTYPDMDIMIANACINLD